MIRLVALLVFAAPALAAGPHAATLLTPDAWAKLREGQKLAAEAGPLRKAGKLAEAADARARAAAAVVEVYGTIPAGELGVMDRVASIMLTDGQTARAIEVRKAIEKTFVVLHGEDDWRTAWARMLRAEAERMGRMTDDQRAHWFKAQRLDKDTVRLTEEGRFEQALAAARESLALREGLLGADDFRVSLSLTNLGTILQMAGRPREGIAPARRAVAIKRRVLGDGHPETAIAMNNLGTILEAAGEPAEARALIARAVDVLLATRGTGYVLTVRCMVNLVALDQHEGVRPDTLRRARQAVAAARRLGDKSRELGQALALEAGVLARLGDTEAAIPVQEEAVRSLLPLGERHPVLAMTRLALAEMYCERGDFVRALAMARQAVGHLAASVGKRHPEYAEGLLNLAKLHARLGDPREAVAHGREAARVLEAALGRTHPRYATALLTLAHHLEAMDSPREGLAEARKALAIYEARFGKTAHRTVAALSVCAYLMAAAGDDAAAARAYRDGLARTEGPGVELARSRQDLLANLGCHEMEAGRPLEALRWFRQVEPLTRTGRPVIAIPVLSNITLAWHMAGRDDLARRYADRLLEVNARLRDAARLAQSDRLITQTARDLLVPTRLRLALDAPGDTASYRHLLEAKGHAFATQRHRHGLARLLARQEDARGRELAEGIAHASRDIGRCFLMGTREAEEEAARLTRRRELLEVELAGLGGALPRTADATPAALAAALPEGVALVDFIQTAVVHPGEGPMTPRVDHPLLAFVSRRGAATARVELGSMAEIRKHLEAWRRKTQRGADAQEEGRALRRLVWEPAEKKLGGATTVLLSPDNDLGRLPFGALPGAKPGTFLIEEKSFAVVPAPRLLLEPAGGGTRPSLFAAGGVDFTGRIAGGAPGSWPALPASLREAREVAARFRGRHGDAPATLLGGDRATRDAVRAGLTAHSFAHLATHGYFAAGRDGGVVMRRGGDDGPHPGLRAGVVLARGELLTALEVASLDLSGLELAVLSACETGLGAEGGEGVLGLQRAFQAAGCRRVVASLWSVDDAATSVLMERFYHHLWKEKRPTLEALRRAQIDVLRGPELVEARAAQLRKELGESSVRGVGKEALRLPGGARRSPPAWWGAFVLSGDWR